MDNERNIQFLIRFVRDVLSQSTIGLLTDLNHENVSPLTPDDNFVDFTDTWFTLGTNQLGDGVGLG